VSGVIDEIDSGSAPEVPDQPGMFCDYCRREVDAEHQLFALRVPPGGSLPIPAVTCGEKHMDLLRGIGWREPSQFEATRGYLALKARNRRAR